MTMRNDGDDIEPGNLQWDKDTEDVIMQYAGSHGHLSNADKSRIAQEALNRIDAIESYAASKYKRRNTMALPIGIAASIVASIGLYFGLNAHLNSRNATVNTHTVATSPATSGSDSITDVVRRLQFDYNVVSDPTSKHIPLSGTSYAIGMRTQVFWNEMTNVMFIDRSTLPSLPSGEAYSVWGIQSAGEKTLIGVLPSDPGNSPLVKVGCDALTKRVVITKAPASQSRQYSASNIVFDSALKP